MATNFLYMFEFFVDDLLITKPNCCAPEEYPTCVEISFRSNVFICICDREFNKCIDLCAAKCCKCCLFTLDSEVTDKDRLKLHVYKKKDEKCKFLEGAADLPVKTLFDKVNCSFDQTNPNWLENLSKFLERVPDPMNPNKPMFTDCFTCDDCQLAARPEQFCPTNAIIKRLVPLYNMQGVQTGNISLIVRLVCNGPTIVSSYAFSSICKPTCENAEQMVIMKNVAKPTKCGKCVEIPPASPCVQPDPCLRCTPKKPPCKRYFSCNLNQQCPCSDCEDYCDRECPTGCAGEKAKRSNSQSPCKKRPSTGCAQKAKTKSNGNMCEFTKGDNQCSCMDCQGQVEMDAEVQNDDTKCFEPYLIKPTKPKPGPDAYEEFEAGFNDCGLVIRVLKDTHQVEQINDGDNVVNMEPDCDNNKKQEMEPCESLFDLYKTSAFVRRKIQTHTLGNIINHPILPNIRANIKYSAKDICFPEYYHMNFTNLKNKCQAINKKIEYFRSRKQDQDCRPNIVLGPTNTRNCCLQVEPKILAETTLGKYSDNRKKGIECDLEKCKEKLRRRERIRECLRNAVIKPQTFMTVCHKTCNDLDSDVFLLKLGKKEADKSKKNSIEIELKTPKVDTPIQKQRVTTETQITEAELDAALALCKKRGKKKGKGKRKGKGRGKGKGRKH